MAQENPPNDEMQENENSPQGQAPHDELDHPAISELVFEMKKIAEIDLENEVPDEEWVTELEETLPKLPDSRGQSVSVRKLVYLAEIIVIRARAFETLTAREAKSVRKALKPFASFQAGKSPKVVGNPFVVLKSKVNEDPDSSE